MTPAKLLAFVEPYLTQLPTSSSDAEVTMATLGPCLCSTQKVAGVVTQKANRNAVDTQLMLVSDVLKYCADVDDTGANAIQSHDTTMLRSTSCASPKNRRLYTLYGTLEVVEMRDNVRPTGDGRRMGPDGVWELLSQAPLGFPAVELASRCLILRSVGLPMIARVQYRLRRR